MIETLISIENTGSKIFVFRRDETGVLHKDVVSDFKPYFYVEDESGEFISIDGKKLKKIFVSNPKDVRGERERYNHYEADVIYTSRYLIDRVDTIEKTPIRKCYVDIEVSKREGFPSPAMSPNKILSICTFDSFLNKYFTWILSDVDDIVQEENWSKYYFIHERAMLESFVLYIQTTDPDLLIAWNGDVFDFPYLVNRLKRIGVNENRMSRLGVSLVMEDKTMIKGRILFDLMRGYKKITFSQKESYALDFISKQEFGEGKEKYEGSLDDLYDNDKDKFISYNKRDVELLRLIDEKLMVVEFFDNVRRYARCHFIDVFQNSKVIDQLVLDFARKKGVVLPSKNKGVEDKFEGAYVHQPKAGLFSNVACLDMKSLYPSIMITFNLGFETLLPCYQDGCINIDNKYFYSKKESLVKQILQNLIDERKKYRKNMTQAIIDSTEYRAFDSLQYAVKVIANSLYGVVGYPGFRLYKKEVAETVTYLGRRIIKYANEKAVESNYEVIYNDTDSIFITIGENTIDDVHLLRANVNNSFKEFVERFNVESKDSTLELEFEKVYKTIFFTNAKKRYAGLLFWKGGEFTNKIQTVGFETRRSDYPEIGRNFLKELFKRILYQEEKQTVVDYVSAFKSTIKSLDVVAIGFPIGISKAFNEYRNLPIHIRAVKYANQYHHAEFKQWDKIKYIYVSRNPRGNSAENVIAFKDKLWDGYTIDYDKMIERIVDNKVTTIFEALGWEYSVGREQSKKLSEYM